MLERVFKLKEHNTTVGREVLGGVTTFATMSYILFVQPVILSWAGMDKGAVFAATCIASALSTFLMAFLANLPIALAPGMGENVFFSVTVCGAVAAGGLGLSWQQALGAVLLGGSVIIVISYFGLRAAVLNAIPRSIKNAIALGIGLLIAALGLEYAGILVPTLAGKPPFLHLGPLASKGVLLAICTFVFTFALSALRVRGAILIGIVGAGIVGYFMGIYQWKGAEFASISPTLFKFDIPGIFIQAPSLASAFMVIFVLFFLDLFDSVGTLVGVGEQAGYIKEDGTMPKARPALFSDAVGTVIGATMGTSTITSYVESAAGVAAGARTGLSSIVTGILMLLSLLIYPLVSMVGSGYVLKGAVVENGVPVADAIIIYPAIASAMLIVGCIMMANAVKVNWQDWTEAIPAFCCVVIMAFTFSISDGIGFAFVSYTILKAVTRRLREGHYMVYLFAAFFFLYFVLKYVFLLG
jgi:AGZA family xanthine/uracil permease-like MFS transporter